MKLLLRSLGLFFSLQIGQISSPSFPLSHIQDSNRVAAEKLVAEAGKLEAENSGAARAQALDKLKQALPLWRAAIDVKGEAETLNTIAEILEINGSAKEAVETAERALQLFQSINDRTGEAKALSTIAEVNLNGSDVPKAVEYFKRALDIWQQTTDQKQQAATLNNLAMAYDELGESRTAMSYLDQSLVLRRAAGDRLGEASTLAKLGRVFYPGRVEVNTRSVPVMSSLRSRQKHKAF